MTDVRTSSATISRLGKLAASCLLAAAGFLGTSHFAHAAALTSTNVQPASLVAGASTTVTVTFTTATNLLNTEKVRVIFPSGFDISTLSAPVSCSGMDGAFTFGTSSQTVTLTRTSGTTATAPATISCTMPTIRNPQVSGSTGTYTISTLQADGVTVIDTDAAVAADTITAATLTTTNVQPSALILGITNTVTATFTTVNPVPANGKIRIVFPSGFDVSGATSGSCSTMDERGARLPLRVRPFPSRELVMGLLSQLERRRVRYQALRILL